MLNSKNILLRNSAGDEKKIPKMWGFRFLLFCADGGEDFSEGGGGGEMGCRIVPGDVVLLWFLGYGDCGGGVVFRCPSVRIVVVGLEGDGVAEFRAEEC